MSFGKVPEGVTGMCSRCNAPFTEGSIRFRVDVHVTADNGTGASVEELEGELKELVELLEGRQPKRVDDELQTSLHFYLCKMCRDEYVKGPETPLSSFFFGE